MSRRMSLPGRPTIAQIQTILISGLPFIDGIHEFTN